MNEPLTTTIAPSGVLTLTLAGDLSVERLPALRQGITAAEKQIQELSQERRARIHILLDMSQFSGVYDVGAMEAMARFARDNAPYIEKTAGFGAPVTGTFAGEIVAELANRDNIQFFPDEPAALAWLAV